MALGIDSATAHLATPVEGHCMRNLIVARRKGESKLPLENDSEALFAAFLVAAALSMLAMICGIALAIA